MNSEERAPRNQAVTAALVGGAVAATAGAVWSARTTPRRNGAADGKPLNAVMKTAATACELAHGHAACEAGSAAQTSPDWPGTAAGAD